MTVVAIGVKRREPVIFRTVWREETWPYVFKDKAPCFAYWKRKPRMRASVILACGLALSTSVCALPAFAHHGFQAEFDCNSPVSLKGVVSEVDWVNPHVWTHITVDEAGKPPQDWMIYGG